MVGIFAAKIICLPCRVKSEVAPNIPDETLCKVAPPNVAHAERSAYRQEKSPERVIMKQRVLGVERRHQVSRKGHCIQTMFGCFFVFKLAMLILRNPQWWRKSEKTGQW